MNQFGVPGVPSALRPLPTWETIYEAPSGKSYKIEIVLVHDLQKRDLRDLRQRLESVVKGACRAAIESAGVSLRVSVYRVNYTRLQKRFEDEVEKLRDCVDSLQGEGEDVNQASGLPPSQTQTVEGISRALPLDPRQSWFPKIIFIAYELGAWLVRRYYQTLLQLDHPKDPEILLGQFAGIIFLGADESANFQYSKYLDSRLTKLRNANAANPDLNAANPTDRFGRRLRIIDNDFLNALQSERVALTTWILPAPSLSSSVQLPLPFRRSDSGDLISHIYRDGKWPSIFRRRRTPEDDLGRVAKNSDSDNPSADDQSPETILQSKISIVKNLIVAENPDIKLNEIGKLKDSYRYPKKHRVPGMLHETAIRDESVRALIQQPRNLASENLPEGPSVSTSIYSANSAQPKETLDELRSVELNQTVISKNASEDTSTNPASSMPTQNFSQNTNADRDAQAPDDPATIPSAKSSLLFPHKDDVDLKKFQEKAALARSYFKRDDFDRARPLYDECLKMFEGKNTTCEAFLRTSMEKALLDFQIGDYREARNQLETLEKRTSDTDLFKLNQETRYHLTIALVRQGDYPEAFEELRSLREKSSVQKIEECLQPTGPLPRWLLDDPEVVIVLGATRLLGLLNGYYGRYKEASETLEKAKTWCDRFLEARKNSLSAATLTHTSADQGDLGTFMKEVTQQNLELQNDTEAMKAKIDLARAKLSMLQGEDGAALEIAGPTLRSLQRRLGIRHTLALEAASLNALILSRKFDSEAERICAITIGASCRHLGKKHPLTMEALSTLVDIFLAQGRPFEAHDTVSTLSKQAKEMLGDSHPQTLRYQIQLGDVDIYIGNHLSGKEQLQNTYEAARTKWEDQGCGQYPDLLRYSAKLALANIKIGKLAAAQQLVEEALKGQAKIFRDESTQPSHDVNSILERLLPAHQGEFAVAIAPHSDVLESLDVYASILEMTEYLSSAGQRELILDTLQLIYKEMRRRYGDSHFLTLKSGVRLGFSSLVASDMSRLGNAKEFFYGILRESKESLGSNHTTTWMAKIGNLFKNSEEHGQAMLRSELSTIVSAVAAHLGPSHPMALDALARLFTVELIMKDKAAHDTADRLLGQLREREVRKQRLIASLYLEEMVAIVYRDLSYYEQCLPIFDKLQGDLGTAGELREIAKVANVTEELKHFEKRVGHSSQQARVLAKILLERTSDEGDKELKDREYGPAETARRRAVSLSRALYGENDLKTVKACLALAEVLHEYHDSQKRLEGLSIIGNLLVEREVAKIEQSQPLEGYIPSEAPQVHVSEAEEKQQSDNDRENKDKDELEDLYKELEKRYEEWQWQYDPSENEGQEEAEDDVQHPSENSNGQQPEEDVTR